MEKEMKKLLLVAVSVGVFLLVTITAAIVILSNKTTTQGTSFSSSQPLSSKTPPVETTVDIQPPVLIDMNDSNIAVIADRNNGDSLTINIPNPSTAAVPAAAVEPETKPAVSVVVKPETKPVPAAKPAPTAVKPAPAANAAKPAAPKKPAAAKATNDYWVQTGAFSAMIRAEDAKETLASKGITSIIENRIVNGKTWYRVRLGPYTSEKEANYWLALVKTIDGFAESQVRHTIRQQ